jgi:hypothetical protein
MAMSRVRPERCPSTLDHQARRLPRQARSVREQHRQTNVRRMHGGIAVVSSAPDGADPVGNLIKANRVRDNQPDLFYDGTGSGNVFMGNSCQTSIPDGLC